MRMAINGRMGLIGGGVIMLLTAISSTLMYGINMLAIVSEASKGNAEYIEMLEISKLDMNLVRVIGICFFILAVVEVVAGIFSLRFSNRLDKCLLMRKIILMLIVIEVLMQILLVLTGMMNFSMLITSLLVPLYMLWSTARLCRLAKEYPERTYVVDKQKSPAPTAKQAPKKSLHERAMMPSSLSDQEEAAEETSGQEITENGISEPKEGSEDQEEQAQEEESAQQEEI